MRDLLLLGTTLSLFLPWFTKSSASGVELFTIFDLPVLFGLPGGVALVLILTGVTITAMSGRWIDLCLVQAGVVLMTLPAIGVFVVGLLFADGVHFNVTTYVVGPEPKLYVSVGFFIYISTIVMYWSLQRYSISSLWRPTR